ncbi:hypothetical protein [Candidatus Venteria ishoeyi]|uniref:DUF3060 domain-containing protein n=1 Tax=Candidatus Venteria ishoeyi TaxID=1899563 RepID=A0A1H6F5Q9_9GAMM|nr:hypothetical protein [Candidatus Venteria ishoeyi]SEH04893.1 Uncharacterised protein [Candidatus Venteria ishoeyi]
MKLIKFMSIIALSSSVLFSTTNVLADAKTTVENQSKGSITSNVDVNGSANIVESRANAVSVKNQKGTVKIRSRHTGDITSNVNVQGSANIVESHASAVSVENGGPAQSSKSIRLNR